LNPSLSGFRPKERGQVAEAQAGGDVCPWCSKAQSRQSHGEPWAKAEEADTWSDGRLYSDSGDSPVPSQVFGTGIALPPGGHPAWRPENPHWQGWVQNRSSGPETPQHQAGRLILTHTWCSLGGSWLSWELRCPACSLLGWSSKPLNSGYDKLRQMKSKGQC